jgi:hypothetical protein
MVFVPHLPLGCLFCRTVNNTLDSCNGKRTIPFSDIASSEPFRAGIYMLDAIHQEGKSIYRSKLVKE